jgi:hypothetical protein
MRREDLDHVISAAAQIVGETEFVVVGSHQPHGGEAHAVGDDTARAVRGGPRRARP